MRFQKYADSCGRSVKSSEANLEKAMVSVLQKELGNKGEKLKYKKVGGHAADDQNQILTSSW